MWANCQSAIERADTLLVDGKFVSFQTRRAVLSILREALERVIDSGLTFLIQDMAEIVEKVEALDVWKAEAVEKHGQITCKGAADEQPHPRLGPRNRSRPTLRRAGARVRRGRPWCVPGGARG